MRSSLEQLTRGNGVNGNNGDSQNFLLGGMAARVNDITKEMERYKNYLFYLCAFFSLVVIAGAYFVSIYSLDKAGTMDRSIASLRQDVNELRMEKNRLTNDLASVEQKVKDLGTESGDNKERLEHLAQNLEGIKEEVWEASFKADKAERDANLAFTIIRNSQERTKALEITSEEQKRIIARLQKILDAKEERGGVSLKIPADTK